MSLDKRIDDLRELPENWDGYKGSRITCAALSTARQIQFVPESGGGLAICIDGEGVMVQIGPDGKIKDVNIDMEDISK